MQEIVADKRSRREIQRDIKAKERAIETLSSIDSREPRLSRESVRQVLYNIGSNHAFLRTNRYRATRLSPTCSGISTRRRGRGTISPQPASRSGFLF